MEADGELETVARLTSQNGRAFVAAFRSHTGRWDPLPGEGTWRGNLRGDDPNGRRPVRSLPHA